MKRILAMAISVLLVATLAIGGTVAYLTDTEGQKNVMVLGTVNIEQIEQEYNRDENSVVIGNPVDFQQNKPLYPAYYDEAANTTAREGLRGEVDKIVSVKNTGKSPVYVRTLFAFEGGAEVDWAKIYDFPTQVVHVVKNDTPDVWSWEWLGVYKIGGSEYRVAAATYQKVLGTDETSNTTPCSLDYVYMDRLADNANIEKYGNTYEIYALSQAVQTENMDHLGSADALNVAFNDGAKLSESDTKIIEWFSGIVSTDSITTAEGLRAALGNGGNVVMSASVNVAEATAAGKVVMNENAELDFGANFLSLDLAAADDTTVNWAGLWVEGENVNAVLDGTTGGVKTAANANLTAVAVRDGANLTINNGNYIGGEQAVYVDEGVLTINGGYFEAQPGSVVIGGNAKNLADGTAKIVISGGTFKAWDPSAYAVAGTVSSYVSNGATYYVVGASSSVPANNAALMDGALSNGKTVEMTSDVSATTTINTAAGSKLDGKGNTLTSDVPKVEEATQFAVKTSGGEVSNLTIISTGRSIGTGSGLSGDLTIDNVKSVGPNSSYAFNFAVGNNHKLTVKNSVFNGWGSVGSGFSAVSFENCSFGHNDNKASFWGMRLYNGATFTNCAFAADYGMNVPEGFTGTITLNNCTYAGASLSAETFLATLYANARNDAERAYLHTCEVIVDGVEVEWPVDTTP